MAISDPTLLNTNTDTATNATIASGSISPAGNALLIAIIATGNTAGTFTPTSMADALSGGSLTWNKISELGATSVQSWVIAAFWAVTGATPGSGVVTGTFAANGVRDVIHILQVASGFNPTTPIVQFKTGATVDNFLTVTLDATPDTGNLVIGGVASRGDTAGIIVGTTFTELADTLTTGGANATAMQSQFDNASPPAGCDWTGLGVTNNVGIAFEIAAAAVGGGSELLLKLMVMDAHAGGII